jgi:Rv0078B-related antitoxin
MRPRDTTQKAAAIAAALNRAAGPERRFAQALELSDLLQEMARAGMRSRYPGLSDEELNRMRFAADICARK